mgnify:CR=1 FL=1
MVTQNEIVERLGVSQSAVSFALSPDEKVRSRISEKLRDRIVREAQRLNYQPGRSTRKTKVTTKTIALLESQEEHSYCHPTLVRSVHTSALQSSYLLNHFFYDPESGLPDEFLNSVDGIVSLVQISPQDHKLLESRGTPIIMLNTTAGDNSCDVVMPDHYSGLRQAMHHLFELGHRRFAFFGLQDFSPHHAQRYGAFMQLALELKLPYVPEVFVPFRTDRSLRNVDEKVREMLSNIARMKDRPTALVCAVDVYALPVLRLAGEFGLRVPEDLSVIGMDNIQECQISTPTLSSISLLLEDLGSVATHALIRRIDGCSSPNIAMMVDTQWIPRDSIAPPSKDAISNI